MGKKVVLITGASSGMGEKTAFELLKLGYTVYGGARRVDRMAKLTQLGGHALSLDVTNEDSMVQCVNQIIEQEGRIDILINNAGYGSCGSIEDVNMDEARHQYEVNVFGLGRMTQLVLPYMRKQNSGRIVNIASMGGRFTTPFCGWYHSTKYAVESISDALRMELRLFNIDVIIIEPGLIQTDWGVIAAKNIRKSSGNGVYKDNADNAARYYEERYGNSKSSLSDPAAVAAKITKAVTAKHPKTRYLIGKNAKLYIFLKAVLCDKLFQSVTVSSMGLKK